MGAYVITVREGDLAEHAMTALVEADGLEEAIQHSEQLIAERYPELERETFSSKNKPESVIHYCDNGDVLVAEHLPLYVVDSPDSKRYTIFTMLTIADNLGKHLAQSLAHTVEARLKLDMAGNALKDKLLKCPFVEKAGIVELIDTVPEIVASVEGVLVAGVAYQKTDRLSPLYIYNLTCIAYDLHDEETVKRLSN